MKKIFLYVLLTMSIICIIGLNVSIALSDSYELRLKQLESLANEGCNGLEDGESLNSSETVATSGKTSKTVQCDNGGTKIVCESTNNDIVLCHSLDETECSTPGESGSGSGSGNGSGGSDSGSGNGGGAAICEQQGHQLRLTSYNDSDHFYQCAVCNGYICQNHIWQYAGGGFYYCTGCPVSIRQ
jgi:hypothetical protein